MISEPSSLRRSVVIGVVGGTGAGKTTISRAILERVGAHAIAYLQHDAYYRDLGHLPLEERKRTNFDHPDALEDELLVRHVQELLVGHCVQVPVYDYARHTRSTETRTVCPQPIILLEGILLFTNPALRAMMDIRIFVDTDADLRFIRRLQRDIGERGRTVASVIAQYLDTVRPMHLEFVEPSKRYADIIVPEGGYNTVALDMICAHILEMQARQNARAEQDTGVA
jgi:uridine kinase